MTRTVPNKYEKGVPVPNKMTIFVDIIGQSNFSCPIKDELFLKMGTSAPNFLQ